MLGDLGNDLIGTNPVYPKIVNHDWLSPQNYDNYPSDNNPVRVVPKLSEMWNHEGSGIRLVPNTSTQQPGCRSAEQQQADSHSVTQAIVREAKKAAMAGLQGKALTGHLRARYTAKQLLAATEELKKVSAETGLLGNVYIDGSAFASLDEATQFLTNHRNRLARDILVTEDLNQSIMSMLASKFRKNVVSSVNYTPEMLETYKRHLVALGKIPADFEIDSKEALRAAFLYVPEAAPVVKTASAEPVLDPKVISESLSTYGAEQAMAKKEASDALTFRRIKNVVAFAQETLSKGKDAMDLKGMLRKKYVMADIKDAADYLAIVISSQGLTDEHINDLVMESKFSFDIGEELKKIARKYPVRKDMFEKPERKATSGGIQGYFYNLSGQTITDQWESYRKASVTALLKGIEPEKIKDKLLTKMSNDEADKVLSDAVALMNSVSAGVVANKAQKPKKAVLFEEPSMMPELPDPSTIEAKTNEIADMFKGADTTIDVGSSRKYEPLEVGELFNRDGLDSVM